jgi:hypothetical protein
MLKKVLIGIAVVLALLVAAGFVYRDAVFMLVMASQIAPDHDFDPGLSPAPPDYTKLSSWAAHPDIDDPSDQRPDGVDPIPTDVAVFFVHPTSFLEKSGWNQPLANETANWIVDHRVLRHQATVFNSCCEVMAPRYRQATFFSFMDTGSNGEQALDLAYTDVVSAFETFRDGLAPDQPFILAGHSQGTMHATRLLREEIAGSMLLDRMVAAYLVGFSITADDLGGVPACATPTQTRCAVGWNAIDGPGSGAFGGTDNLLCVNPLTWRYDESYAGHELNAGAIGYPSYGLAAGGEDHTAMDVEPSIADAQCSDGQLVVSDLRSASFPSRMLGNSMHIYDYSLYHMNIRENVNARVGAFLKSGGGAVSSG